MTVGSYVPGYTKCPKCGSYATVQCTKRPEGLSLAVRQMKCDACGYCFKAVGPLPRSRRRGSGRPKFWRVRK